PLSGVDPERRSQLVHLRGPPSSGPSATMLSAWWQPTVSGKGPAYGEPVILAKSLRDALVPIARDAVVPNRSAMPQSGREAGHDPAGSASRVARILRDHEGLAWRPDCRGLSRRRPGPSGPGHGWGRPAKAGALA